MSRSSSRRTVRRRNLKARAHRSPSSDTSEPHDTEEMRVTLTRKIVTFMGDARRCRDRHCRRARACVGATMRCLRDNPATPLTPEETARAKAEMYRLVQRRRDEIDALAASPPDAPASTMPCDKLKRARQKP